MAWERASMVVAGAALAVAACGGGDGAAGDAATGCSPATCADGCCAGDVCTTPTAAACGTGGAACESCVDDLRADSCEAGGCVCAATGARCAAGDVCEASGCALCEPDCTGVCAGGDDGCGGSCPTTDCDAGCCDADGACVAPGAQTDSACGVEGEQCADCTRAGKSCHATLSICTSPLANDAELIEQDVPMTMSPGQLVDVSVTMRNTGTATWAAGTYKLGSQNPPDSATWGMARVELDAGEDIAPGDEKTFSFQVTAPSSPGVHDFQWRMVQETVEWFGEHSEYVPVVVGGGSVTVCEAARALADTDTDATLVIGACIDAAGAGEIVELPAGVYRIDDKLELTTGPITLRTEGTDITTAPCALVDHDCAELRGSTAFADTGGILQVLRDGMVIDHIVVHGNKTARAGTPSGSQCAAASNSYGYNMRVACDDCTVTNSVSRDALCGTGLEVSGTGSGVVLWRNQIVDNGVHDAEGLWADGVTVHDYAGSTFVANTFRDNTDVDFIFGGCQTCIVQGNAIEHTAAFAGGAFAALMLHAWPSGATSGNFTGTDTSRNTIDCGPSRRCGFGLYLGPDAWYDADTYGGAVHHNVVSRAEQGVLIDDAHDVQVFNNFVEDTGASTDASCGTRATGDYGIGTTSVNIDTSRDTMGTSYDDVDFDGCIPNWWNP